MSIYAGQAQPRSLATSPPAPSPSVRRHRLRCLSSLMRSRQAPASSKERCSLRTQWREGHKQLNQSSRSVRLQSGVISYARKAPLPGVRLLTLSRFKARKKERIYKKPTPFIYPLENSAPSAPSAPRYSCRRLEGAEFLRERN